jgi:hypothetical protein
VNAGSKTSKGTGVRSVALIDSPAWMLRNNVVIYGEEETLSAAVSPYVQVGEYIFSFDRLWGLFYNQC